jgi:spermidine synthase
VNPAKALNAKRSEAREYQMPHSGIFFEVEKVLHDRKSGFQRIEIVHNRDYGKVLLLDGLVQTTERDEFYYHEMLVHPAMSSHRKPANVLVIGGGDGGALREVLKHPVRKVWMVEIDSEVVEACKKHFGWIKTPLKDKRAELVIGDGNEFVDRTDQRFDVIVVDSSDPVGPSTVLHQEAFYRKLKARLKPGGIVAGQAGSLLLHLDSHVRKAAFLRKIFRFSRLYLGPVPTYPVGIWCYDFLADDVDPVAERKLRIPAGLKFYNSGVHGAAFAQPNFLREALGVPGKKRSKP